VLVLLYVLAALGCAAFQRRMLYFPRCESAAALDRAAGEHNLQRWRNAAGHELGWKRMASRHPAEGEILITDGNGGCAIDRVDWADAIAKAANMDVFILEYPGYGDRAGAPSEHALFSSAEEGFQALQGQAPIYLVGESLGTGVAAHVAGTHPDQVAGVLLVAPYNRLADVAQYHLRVMPAKWLLREHFVSEDYLKAYHGPVGILVGGKDEVVPAKFGRRLFDRYAGPKRIWEVPEAGHESVRDRSTEFWREVLAFWKERK